MDPPKDSPAPPVDGPLQKNAPLAPSQEAAYRKKCIQLKRRLQEIEADNDAKRKRIEREKQHVQKMRLNRAILLDHLNKIMNTPGKKLTPDQLAQLGIVANGAGHPADFIGPDDTHALQEGDALLDDSSDESEEEPEPAEKPERRRRPNNPPGEAIMTTTNPSQPTPPSYPPPQNALPNIAPASSLSPTAGRNPTSYAFQMESGTPAPPPVAAPARPPSYQAQQPYAADYPQSSPHQAITYSQVQPPPVVREPPPRPDPPFTQFTDHMRPQLEADNYPHEQITARIQQEWDNLSSENRALWDQRYQDQMVDFTKQMDEYKRQQRQQGGSFSDSRNRTLPTG